MTWATPDLLVSWLPPFSAAQPVRRGVAPGLRAALLLWEEGRPVVQAVFALRVLTGAVLAAGAGPVMVTPGTVAAALGWAALVLATYVLNGVSDVFEDRLNGSSRPLASGRLQSRTAYRAAQLLTAGGLLLLSWSPVLLVLGVTMAAAGWAYSSGPRPLKRQSVAAALTCAAGGLLTYLAGAAAVGGRLSVAGVVVACAAAVWMAVAGAAKDLGDVAGDRAAGRRTLPVMWGETAARRRIAAATLLLAGVCLAAGHGWPLALAAAVPMGVGALAVAVLCCTTASLGSRARCRRPYRAFVTTQWALNASVLFTVVA